MPRIDDLELCIEDINSATTPEQAFDCFCAIFEDSGYNRIAYSLVTDHPSLGLPKQHGLATSYPDDWIEFYNENNYLEIDPVVHQVLKSRKPFFWNDLLQAPGLAKNSLLLMNQAQEAGIHSGIGFSLSGLLGEVVGVGLARDDAGESSKDYDFLAKAYLLSTYFHETYRDLLQQPKAPSITARESDVLHWAAEGKTDREIGEILGISVNTVRFHWKKIFSKLNSKGRTYAITKSIRLGIVNPEIVRFPYQKW